MEEDSAERQNEIEMMDDEEENKRLKNVKKKVICMQTFTLKFKLTSESFVDN